DVADGVVRERQDHTRDQQRVDEEGDRPLGDRRQDDGADLLGRLGRGRVAHRHSAASASASDIAGCTRRLSTMSDTLRLAVTASASTEISSAAWRPTIEPPSTPPVAGSDRIFTKPLGSLLMSALGLAENGTLVARILRPMANASASARPTSA